MDIEAGTLVTPSVRLLRPLGQGGMGSLWVAEHLVERKEVAVKFVDRDLAEEDPKILERFDREAEVLAQLDSPHVVRLYERGMLPDGRTPFIVMELLHGETLVERVERLGQLPLPTMGFLVSQLATVLTYVHSINIIHRDLKGENVFLLGGDEQPLVKLLDFGLAKAPGTPGQKMLTGIGTMVGTAEYMSPEQIVSAKDVDARADLWAFGVLVYVALLAALPFRGKGNAEMFLAIRTAQYEPASALREGLPPAVDAWFAKAFHMDIAERFATAAEMNDAWQRAVTAEPVEAAPLEPRRPAWLAGAAALGLLVLAAVVYAML
ncbi:MAG: serine/threonine-protein kinase [Polyangiaceae bacterium]